MSTELVTPEVPLCPRSDLTSIHTIRTLAIDRVQDDTVVLVAGQPIGRPGATNLMKLHRVGELH